MVDRKGARVELGRRRVRIRAAAGRQATIGGLVAGLASVGAISVFAGAGVVQLTAALAAVYVLGYGTGALLVHPQDDRATLSLAIVRLVAGLLLSTVAFFLSLLLPLPWFAGPVAVCSVAVVLHRRAVLAPPHPTLTVTWDGALAGLLSGLVLAPILIAAGHMAPGDYSPVFYHVDTPYFLEKVHALVKTEIYPPTSLGVVDGRFSYHFAAHGLTALIARASGLAPHHTLFLIVLPLLSVGVLAAAVLGARSLGAALPAWVAVPMLLIPVPTLWYRFWDVAGPGVAAAISSLTLGPLDGVTARYEMWGATSNNGHNIAAQFVVLGSLAGIAAARTRGWRLPVFLIGSAFLVKSPTGLALAAGLALAQAYRTVATRSARPLMPVVAAAGVFVGIYGAFWNGPPEAVGYRLELFPFYQVKRLLERDELTGFWLDVGWLLLPAAVILLARQRDPMKRSAPLLLFAVPPFFLVNSLRLTDMRPGFAVSDDWLQVMSPAVPLAIHAFVLSLAAQRWTRLGPGLRATFLLAIGLSILPPVFAAARYSRLLIVHPERGHEFVDNRALGEALSVIPTEGAIIVTNDLRYPAQDFSRRDRQMQIPGLFGHQAFAVNYAYEAYSFSRERRQLQDLLSATEWSDDITEAARTHRWTHLLIRKDYTRPQPLPLEPIFENDLYTVFRFDKD